MYVTADGGEEFVHESPGAKVMSVDVMKAGTVFTHTPRGRMTLMHYFSDIEQDIGQEVATRKSDIAAVRAEMARDFAFNAASRAKLQKDMLHKMAVNAKKARDDLNKAMRKTQEPWPSRPASPTGATRPPSSVTRRPTVSSTKTRRGLPVP
jgi:hypothetical protein